MKKINVVNVVGLPVLINKKSFFLSEEELTYIKNIDYIHSANKESDLKLSKNKYLLKEKILKNLKNFIQKNVEIYTKQVLKVNNDFKLCNSWTTLQSLKTKHHPHVHPCALISVVYYAQCSDSQISFSKDRSLLSEGYHFDYDIIEFNQYNAARWNVDVETGDIIIFPGWLRHEASNNSLTEKRYVVAANYFVKGTLGNNLDASYIKI